MLVTCVLTVHSLMNSRPAISAFDIPVAHDRHEGTAVTPPRSRQLLVGELVETEPSELAAHSRGLDASEGQVGCALDRRVDPDHADLQLVGDVPGPGLVAAEELRRRDRRASRSRSRRPARQTPPGTGRRPGRTGLLPVGTHRRVHPGQDGGRVVRARPLAEGCCRTPRPEVGPRLLRLVVPSPHSTTRSPKTPSRAAGSCHHVMTAGTRPRSRPPLRGRPRSLPIRGHPG